ncbi:ABC transporter, permease protein [Actinobaculum sp. oral taxon 183 str. F0552]|uniref:carbohydrate ABC transporter permease n=1 Tax=Actinobaculum sp. oral taxon 183 TaxID=712888 RepID=UPI00039812C1|nr:carbohydrate ABC transporter permease [Actinobaculum sp. oral taxon 183]ERH16982.1 ABC transporter, permease protein [Actinobaculum sp. oral taxon 183 str. F0552]
MRSPETASRRAIRLRRLSLAATYAMLLAGAAIMVVPFAYSVLTSLKSPEQFASTDPLAFPAPVTGENYSALFSGDRDFTVPLAVTVQVVAVLTVGQVVCSVLAAYAFARLRFPGRRALFWAYVATLMAPPIVTVIPLFSMLSQLGLRNTFAGLVAPFLLGSPYAIFLLRQNFQAIPQEVLDAATLDGAGHWRTLRSIVLPMNRPILAALTLITVVSQWNAFLWPSVIAPGRTWSVLTVATQALQEERSGNWTLVMAATTVALAPLVVLFLAFNRQIVAALGIGDVR